MESAGGRCVWSGVPEESWRNLLFETRNKLSRGLISAVFVQPQTAGTAHVSAAEAPGEVSVTALVPALCDITKG